MEELYRSDTLLVRCIPGADDRRWVVTFDHHGAGGGFDRPGFAQAFLAGEGISQIAVLGSGDHWYQYRDIDLAMAAVRARLAGATRVLTYGSSMGGYAAIRLAERIGAQACLALSPQYSNDPARVPYEWRWSNEGSAIAWLPAVDGPIRGGARTIVIADAHGADAAHIRAIASEIPIEWVAIGHVAHPVGTYLSSVGLLRRAVLDLLDDRFDAAAFARAARGARRRSPIHLGELARLQPRWRMRTGIALAERAIDLAPDNPVAHAVLAARLTAAGRIDAGLAAHARAVELGGGIGDYALPYSKALASAGRRDSACAVAAGLVERTPGSAPLQSWLGELCWQLGRGRQARHHARLARSLVPRNRRYAANVWLYHLPRGIVRLVRAIHARLRPPTVREP